MFTLPCRHLNPSLTRYVFTSTLWLCVGNAGTAMRPLAGVLCAGQGNFVLDGTPRMRERPIDDLVDGLLQVCPFIMVAFVGQEISTSL